MKGKFTIFLCCLIWGCSHVKDEVGDDMNSLKNMSRETAGQYTWFNQPKIFEIEDRSLVVKTSEGTDFFNNPEDNSIVGTAPFLYESVSGDFVAKAWVEPDFSVQWNAVALMVYSDSLQWIKFAFENSDATGPSLVSVVTKGTSDDANGVVLNDQSRIWLALVRKEHNYAMHWSADGINWKMARLTRLKETDRIKVGIEFQSPIGTAKHVVHFFEVSKETVENMRSLD